MNDAGRRNPSGEFGAIVDAIDVVVRCRNEMPYTRRTLEGLARQTVPAARVLFIDCASTDGSREAAIEHGATLIDLRPEDYVPGRVLNMGMEHTRSAYVAFVNADAVPLHPDALAKLIEPLRHNRAMAATFGRQLARQDADRLTRADHDRAFGDEDRVQVRRGVFFSMAASAIRRDVWERLPFDPALKYSEDVDWVHRLAALGHETRYVSEARFEHSHAYSIRAHYKRRKGEGRADTAIFRLAPPSVLRDFARPLAGAVVRDLRAGCLSATSVATRAAQASGYLVGRLQGRGG